MDTENPPRFRLQPGTLRECLEKTTQQALQTGALQPVPTDYELLEQDGVSFLVRILANLRRKDAAKVVQEEKTRISGKEFNPFLPYEADLWVGDISDTHVCILNKFNVVEQHLLMITRGFVDQECLLDEDDFAAIAFCLQEMDGLVFYNGGKLAGASQKHKHLQMVPFPLVPNGINYPLEVLFNQQIDKKASTIPQLPFFHKIASVEREWQNHQDVIARNLYYQYRNLLAELGITALENNRQSAAYNLLLTRQRMIIVPRSQEEYHGISINSLGFAGALLVRQRSQIQQLVKEGILNLLTHVGIPRH